MFSYKNSQIVLQFINEVALNYLENCISLVHKDDELDGEHLAELYMFALASCQILSNIFSRRERESLFNLMNIGCFFIIDELNFQTIFKIQSRKQNELVFSKLTELFVTFK